MAVARQQPRLVIVRPVNAKEGVGMGTKPSKAKGRSSNEDLLAGFDLKDVAPDQQKRYTLDATVAEFKAFDEWRETVGFASRRAALRFLMKLAYVRKLDPRTA